MFSISNPINEDDDSGMRGSSPEWEVREKKELWEFPRQRGVRGWVNLWHRSDKRAT